MNEISNLSSKKTTGNGHIPLKILKKRNHIITHCMKKGIFPDNLKLSDKATTLKRRWFNFNKEKYRTINILTDMSKVFQRIFYKEIDTLKPWCSIFTLENDNSKKKKKHLDKRKQIGVILMDISKAFDTINHSLMLVKSDAYSLSRTSLKLMQNTFPNMQQRRSVNGLCRNWIEAIGGVD